MYNKTKRGLEKAAGIVGVVVASLSVIFAIMAIISAANYCGTFETYDYVARRYVTHYYEYVNEGLMAFGILYGCLNIAIAVLSVMIIGSPVMADGQIKNRSGIRITNLVLLLLSGDLVSAGLLIAVLCMKDIKEEQPVQKCQYVANAGVSNKDNSVEGKVAELKHLKELGVIDEETYKKAAEKILNDIL